MQAIDRTLTLQVRRGEIGEVGGVGIREDILPAYPSYPHRDPPPPPHTPFLYFLCIIFTISQSGLFVNSLLNKESYDDIIRVGARYSTILIG